MGVYVCGLMGRLFTSGPEGEGSLFYVDEK